MPGRTDGGRWAQMALVICYGCYPRQRNPAAVATHIACLRSGLDVGASITAVIRWSSDFKLLEAVNFYVARNDSANLPCHSNFLSSIRTIHFRVPRFLGQCYCGNILTTTPLRRPCSCAFYSGLELGNPCLAGQMTPTSMFRRIIFPFVTPKIPFNTLS